MKPQMLEGCFYLVKRSHAPTEWSKLSFRFGHYGMEYTNGASFVMYPIPSWLYVL